MQPEQISKINQPSKGTIFLELKNDIDKNIKIELKKDSEEELLKIISRKDEIIKSMIHKSRNYMQTIYSMIFTRLRKVRTPETDKLIFDLQKKIAEFTSELPKDDNNEDKNKINIHEYLTSLTKIIGTEESKNKIIIKIHDEEIFLSLDSCIKSGIVFKEFIEELLQNNWPEAKQMVVNVKVSEVHGKNLSIFCGIESSEFPKEETTASLEIFNSLKAKASRLGVNLNISTEFPSQIPGSCIN